MPATIRDIKEKTGLSLATISKYLNGGNVLPENRVKLEAAIKELNYEVNEIARGLVTNKTRTVGILMYSVESPFSGQLMHYVGENLRKAGYGMLICDSCNDEELEKKNVKYLLSKKVDGIIVVPVSHESSFLQPAINAGIPIVLMDRALSDGVFDCVKIDNRMAVVRAMNTLLSNNHKKIAVIAAEREYTGRERFSGFMEAMRQAGLKVPDEYIKRGTHSLATGYKNMKELLELKNRPTAVFMDNYEITLGAMMAINESGFKCPDDISIMGFDDQVIFHLIEPPVYMVEQPMKEMGEKAVEILIQRIKTGAVGMPMEISLSTTLKEGRSIKKI